MATPPKGILIIFTDFPLDEDDAVDEWYTREHVKSRVIVDGFQWGKRYEAIEGTPRYVAVYGTDDVSVLASQGYFDAGSNPDQSEREHVPKFYNTRRTICSVTASAGEGEGGVMGFLALSAEPGREEDLRAWITHMAVPQLVMKHGVVAAYLWETNREALSAWLAGIHADQHGDDRLADRLGRDTSGGPSGRACCIAERIRDSWPRCSVGDELRPLPALAAFRPLILPNDLPM